MNIQKDIPLNQYTTFKTGGNAAFFCEIKDKKDLQECFQWIKKNSIDYFFLGNGSNLLVNDSGFQGIVLKIIDTSTVWNETNSTSAAGVSLSGLIGEAKRMGLGGMEWAFGIPATLGGATRNNAGAYGSSMSNHIKSVEIFDIDTGQFRSLGLNDCGFSYRTSIFQKKTSWLIWQVVLSWRPKKEEEIETDIKKYLDQRREKQPLDKASAGSFFRNPSLINLSAATRDTLIDIFVKRETMKDIENTNKNVLEKEIRDKINISGTIPAAFLIEEAGLKGREIGGAQISEKHANFIVNTGNAKTEDVIILASMIKQKVRLKFGVQLFEEVEYVGF